MASNALSATSFRENVLERAGRRRALIEHVAEVLRPLAQVSLLSDRPGAGEHLMPWTHGGNLKARERQARHAWREVRGTNALLDTSWQAIPSAHWWDSPFAVDLRVDEYGKPSASVIALAE